MTDGTSLISEEFADLLGAGTWGLLAGGLVVLILLITIAPLMCWGKLSQLVKIQRELLRRMNVDDYAKSQKSEKKYQKMSPISHKPESDISKYAPK
jgi:hypothetical protein